jgi:hypothetical protein
VILLEDKVYELRQAVLGEHFEKYAVCANCLKIRKLHVGDACLFSFTTFVHKKGKRNNGKQVPDKVGA